MKKFIYSFAALIAAASVLSCQKEPVEVNTENEGEFVYQFNVASAETKAVLKDDATGTYTKFEKDDVLGIYTKTASASVSYNRRGVIDVLDGQPASFKVYSYYALNSGDFVYAYFPYAKGNDDNKTPDSVILEIPVKQNGRMNAMPMVGIPFSVSESINASENTPVGTIYTQNLGGVFQFRIFSSNTSYCTETVKSVEFTSTSDIAGSFAFDITQNSNLEISDNEGKSITVTQDAEVGSDKSNGGVVNMVVKPGSYTGTLVVTTNAATYTFEVSSEKTVERSHVKPLNVDLNKAVSREVNPNGIVSKTMSEIVSENGYTVSSGSTINTIATEIVLNDVVAMSTTGEANCGSFWGTDPNIDWRLYQNKGGNIILTLAEGYKMTSVTFVYTVGSNGLLKYGETNLSSNVAFTEIKGQSSATFNVSASSDAKGQIKLTSVTVAYTSGEIEKDDSEWMLEPESVAIMLGDYEEVVYATDFDGDIEVSIDDDTVADVALDKDEETITVTGKKIGEATITITATGSDRFKDAELTIPVSVSAKQKVDPTVTIESSATVEAESTVELELEIDNNYDGTITAVSAADGTATASYAAGKVTINGVAPGSTTVTVSAEETENYNAFSKEISVTVTEKAKSREITFANGTLANGTITWNEGLFTLVQAQGSSTTAVGNYIDAPRFYKSHTVTFTPASGITLKKIVFVNEKSDYNGAYKYSSRAISSEGLTHTWTGSSTSAVSFVMDGQARPTSITVYYTGSVVKTDANISFDPSSVTVGEGLNTTVNITTNYDKELTVSSNSANATASISGKVITINGVSAGNAVITVSGTGSELYNDVNETIDVTVNAIPKFSVNIDGGITGGTVVADRTSEIPEGATITLTITPGQNKSLNTLTVKNANTQASVSTSKVREGVYTFQMPAANVNVTAEFAENGGPTEMNTKLTNANIVSGTGSSSYGSCSATDGNGFSYNAYAIKNHHSNATSSNKFWQIKKYASNTAYYIQLPTFPGNIKTVKLTVSATTQPMTGGGNNVTLYFSNSNSTATTGDGVVSGTGASEITLDASTLNLKTGYITSGGAIRIWDIEVTYMSE